MTHAAKLCTLLSLFCCTVFCIGQNRSSVPVTIASSLQDTIKSESFRKAINCYHQNKLKEAAEYFDVALKEGKVPVDVCLSWAAKNMKYMDSLILAEKAVRAALAANANNSLAHEVLGDLLNPQYNLRYEDTLGIQDSVLYHLMQSVQIDSNNASAWKSLWIFSVKTSKQDIEERSLRRLWDIGYFTRSILALNRWQLQHLPPNALLITNGDNDTYPAQALQLMEHLRNDVAVINMSLLNIPHYAVLQSQRHNFPLGFSSEEIEHLEYQYDYTKTEWARTISEQIIEQWLDLGRKGDLARPVVFASTCGQIGESFMKNSKYDKKFVSVGPYSCLQCAFEAKQLRAWVDSLNPLDFNQQSYNPNVEHSPVLLEGSYTALYNIQTGIISVSQNMEDARQWCSIALDFETKVGVKTEMHEWLQQCIDWKPNSDTKPKKSKRKKK